MFLAIINDTYSDIKNEIQQDSIPVGEFVSRKFNYYWNKCCPCRLRIDPSTEKDVNDSRPSLRSNSVKETFDPLPILSSPIDLLHIEYRIEILENELLKIVGRIDTFIANVTHSLNNNEEETSDGKQYELNQKWTKSPWNGHVWSISFTCFAFFA